LIVIAVNEQCTNWFEITTYLQKNTSVCRTIWTYDQSTYNCL